MNTKKILQKLSLSLIITLLLISCGTSRSQIQTQSSIQYDKSYPLDSYSLLKDGYWGEWERLGRDSKGMRGEIYHKTYDYRVQVNYNAQSFEILIYESGKHPSNFIAKINIVKRTGAINDNGWFTYQGTITALKEIPLVYRYQTYHDVTIPRKSFPIPAFELRNDYKTISCTIQCNSEMKKAIDSNGLYGTINLFYGNGTGNAFIFTL